VLFRCEGSRNSKNNMVELVNSDPEVIKIFVKFLKEIMFIPVEKFRMRLQLHIGDNEQECRNYWKQITGLNNVIFQKSILKAPSNYVKIISHTKLRYGTCIIRVHSAEIRRKLIVMANDCLK
jgi:hypothetical protein